MKLSNGITMPFAKTALSYKLTVSLCFAEVRIEQRLEEFPEKMFTKFSIFQAYLLKLKLTQI